MAWGELFIFGKAFGDASIVIISETSSHAFLIYQFNCDVPGMSSAYSSQYIMKTNVRLLSLVMLLMTAILPSLAQTSSGVGTILSIEDGTVYIDMGASMVSPGTILDITSATGNRVGQIVVGQTFDKYSSARPVTGTSLSAMNPGMKVSTPSTISQTTPQPTAGNTHYLTPTPEPQYTTPQTQASSLDRRASVIVPPAQVNDIVGVGYFGGYVADLLMEQLMMCPDVKLIDRSLLGTQVDEATLSGDIIDPSTAIERGKIAGARYAVQVTMQKPDVANVRTGIPLASIMGALQGGLNKNIGAQYMSNMEVARLKAAVSLTARVIDLQTGEVMFMTSGNGKAEGDSQIGMEYGALGGAKLNDGADGFKQTVTGKAIQKAFMSVGRNLDAYFSGKTTQKVMGSASGFGRFDEKLDRRGMSLYSGINKLSNDDLSSILYDRKDLWFKYKSAKKQLRWSNVLDVVGVAATGGGIFLIATYASDEYATTEKYLGYGCTAVGIVSLISGIRMNISAHHKVESIKNAYNSGIGHRNYGYNDYSLDLVTVPGGIGLRLTY